MWAYFYVQKNGRTLPIHGPGGVFVQDRAEIERALSGFSFSLELNAGGQAIVTVYGPKKGGA